MSWKYFKQLFRKADSMTSLDPHATLQQLLKALNVEWEEHAVENSNSEVDYRFQFQSGSFHVMAQAARPYVRIHFLFFMSVPFGQLDNVRYACNEFNQLYSEYKVVYSINEQDHTLGLHVGASFRLSAYDAGLKKDFAQMLSLCFECARAYREIYQSAVDTDESNLEEKKAMTEREAFMAREAELRLLDEEYRWRINETERRTLSQLFRTILGVETVEFSRLRVVTDTLRELTEPDAIASFDLTEPIIRTQQGGEALFTAGQATIIVQLAAMGGPQEEYVVQLRPEEETTESLYFRVSILLPTHGLSPTHSIQGTANHEVSSLHLVMAYDFSPNEERLAEFEYLWEEVQTKIREGQDLEDEQEFLAMCQWPNVGYHLYWGRRFFQRRDYFEAIQHLENAYSILNLHYHQLRPVAKERFIELAYYIGRCYFELRLYRQAYFYLDATYSRSNLKFSTLYVNLLVAARDFRGLMLISNLMKQVQNELANDEDELTASNREALEDFQRFLQRQQAALLIFGGNFDEAETILKELLTIPQQEAEALRLLAKIEQLRNEQNS